MAKSQRMKVTYTDGRELEAVAGPKAQVMVERKFGTSLSKMATEQSAEQGYYLAYAALHCAGLEPNDFEGFLDEIDTIEVAGGQSADPTDSARRPAT